MTGGARQGEPSSYCDCKGEGSKGRHRLRGGFTPSAGAGSTNPRGAAPTAVGTSLVSCVPVPSSGAKPSTPLSLFRLGRQAAYAGSSGANPLAKRGRFVAVDMTTQIIGGIATTSFQDVRVSDEEESDSSEECGDRYASCCVSSLNAMPVARPWTCCPC